MFERKFFIKDLYDLNEIFSKPREIRYLSFNSFVNHMTNKYIYEKQIQIVPISSEEELLMLRDILTNSRLFKKTRVYIHLKDKEIVDRLFCDDLANDIIGTTLYVNSSIANYILEKYEESIFFVRNQIVLYSVMNKDNLFKKYKEDITLLNRARNFNFIYDLRFDYCSFEDMKVKDLQLLKYVVRMLRVWSGEVSSVDTFKCIENSEEIDFEECSRLKTFKVENDTNPLVIYLDENEDIYLDEEKTLCVYKDIYKEKTTKEINYLYSIFDARFEQNGTVNGYFVDLLANIKICKDVFQLPLTAQLINFWMYDVPEEEKRWLTKNLKTE